MAVQNLILPFHLNGQYPFFGLSGAVEVGEFSGQEQMIDWKENWHSPTATTIPTSNCHLVNTHPIHLSLIENPPIKIETLLIDNVSR